jgi:hypothetical protein
LTTRDTVLADTPTWRATSARVALLDRRALVAVARIGTSLPDGAGDAAGVDVIAIREYCHVNVDVNADVNADVNVDITSGHCGTCEWGFEGPLRN